MKGSHADIITALDICADLIVMSPHAPSFGQVEKLADDYRFEIGGSACLFACQCAKLGLRTLGAGTVGGDMLGRLVMDRILAAGVDTALITRDDSAQTGLGVAVCKPDGDRAILTVTGTIDRADPEVIRKNLSRVRHLHIASYYLMRSLRPYWPDIACEAKKYGLSVSVDTNWDPDEKWEGIRDLLPFTDIVFLNEHELSHLTAGNSDIENAARELAASTSLAVVKLGPGGAMACGHGGNITHCPALPVKAIDTVGAGDTFDGGFIYGFLSGMTTEDCLRIGTHCAGRSLCAYGGFAGQPTRRELAATGILQEDRPQPLPEDRKDHP